MQDENNISVAIPEKTSETPLLLKIVSGLMWIEGIFVIVLGIPLVLLLGLGILFINLGISITKYARGVYKLERNVYKKALIVQVAFAIFYLLDLAFGKFSINDGVYSFIPLLALLVIYSYRNLFTNETIVVANTEIPNISPVDHSVKSYFAITKRKAILSIVLAVIGSVFAFAFLLAGADAGIPTLLVIAFIFYPPILLSFGLSFVHESSGFFWFAGIILELLYIHVILSTILLIRDRFHWAHTETPLNAKPHDHDIGKKTLYAVVILLILLLSSPFIIGGLKLLKVKYLSNSKEAQSYKDSKAVDSKTWKSFSSQDDFYTLQYPSWWTLKTGSGMYGGTADNFGDDRTDYFYDPNGYGDFKNMKYITVHLYVGFKDGGQSHAQEYSNMTETRTFMLGGKIPAVMGMYKTSFGWNMPVVITTQAYNGVTFVITDTEPQGAMDNLPLFDQLVSSIQINSAIYPTLDTKN
ncbi:MAG: hypothetical protein ABI747_01495 [Candidatus Moraniibacteriota bacterium]